MRPKNPPTKDQLINLYWKELRTIPQIAKLFGVTHSAVRGWFSKFKITPRTNSQAQLLSHGTQGLDEKELRRLYDILGITQKEIGLKFGITQSAVKERMKKFGIKARGKAHFGKDNGMYGRNHSPDAIRKMRESNKRQFSDPQARERHAILTCEQIKSGKTGKAYNKLEDKVAKLFDAEGVYYIQQYRVGRFLFDFYIPKTNTLVEVHGTFWHADPRVYSPDKHTAIQKRNLANDIRKENRAKQDGFNFAIIWERDV